MSRTKELIASITKNPSLANNIKISDLVLVLKEASDSYYNTDSPAMSDTLFDQLMIILKQRSPKNAFLKKIGAPSKNKVKLPFPMASLDKIKPDLNVDIFDKWIIKYKGPYYISDKLDGVSALLYVNNGSINMFTRGDGLYGQDISHLISKIIFSRTTNSEAVFRALRSTAESLNGIAIRGELIISKPNFKLVNKNNEYKNARNAISGLVNCKTVNEDLATLTEFISYSVVSPNMKYKDQLNIISKVKLNVVENMVSKTINIPNLEDYFKARRALSEYEIDGIVVMDNSKVYSSQVDTIKNPEYGFAFKVKLDEQSAITSIISVEWECSKHGYIKPRVKIAPVDLVGVTITFATAFNAKFVKDNKLGPGAIIEITRSGDVIPDIQRVITPASKASFPNYSYTWSSSKVDIIADPNDPSCKRIITIKKIASFFEAIKAKNLSEGIITKLYDNGYDSILKILSTKNRDNLYKISGLGERIIDKIYQNIDTSMKTITIDKLMAGTTIFGRGLGSKKFKLIFNTYKYSDIMDKIPTVEMITSVNGFDVLTAQQFINGLPRFKKFFIKLSEIYNLSHLNKKTSNKNSIFKGKKIVLTGTRDTVVESFIESMGGSITSSVSKNTYLVIYADTNTSKYTKAISLGIETIELDEFKKKYMG